ncbi:MAG: hypothetical protein Q8O67_32210 [Deltaproteobacteria bacterium]|nr:hypothetical protein [Deltaproteobacteria bacterium]
MPVVDESAAFTLLCRHTPALRDRLVDAVLWCGPRLGSGLLHELRRRLAPNPLRGPALERAAGIPHRAIQYDDSVVEDVCEERRLLVASLQPADRRQELSLQGRILVYFFNESLSDGTSPPASDGFLDNDDSPPWETWLGIAPFGGTPTWRERGLVAFVPNPWVDGCTEAIACNSTDCLAWLDELGAVP